MKNRVSPILLVCIAAVLSVALLLKGCGNVDSEEKILARIGDYRITVSDFNKRISFLPERYQEVIKKRKNEFLQEIINDTLIYQEAVRKGLHKDKDVLRIIEEARKKIIIARYLKDYVNDTIEVTEEEVLSEYSKKNDEYMMPEYMRVSHILVPTREKALEILGKLSAGETFEDLARANSVDPTAQNGGDIGYFPKGQLMPEFERACNMLEPGDISDPVKTKLGYHIIKLTDRKKPVLRPLSEVRDEIRANVRKTKRQAKFNRLLDRLSEETDIEVDKDALEKAGEYTSI